MKSYQDRFRERFCKSPTGGVLPEHRDGGVKLREDILAFIEELLNEQQKEHDECASELADAATDNFKLGRAAEREELAAHVEGMERRNEPTTTETGELINSGYNHALCDLLAHLRQSDAKDIKHHKFCSFRGNPDCDCKNWEQRAKERESQSDAPQGCCINCIDHSIDDKDWCAHPNCPCHKKAPQGDNKQ